ncbi:hypothetical protein BDZ91DRAFT_708920, partial [Kalaharituber pfeilii]
MPAYARWIQVMGVLPVSLQRLVRWCNGCDEAMAKRKVVKKGKLIIVMMRTNL